MSVRNPRVRIVIPPLPNQRDITSTWAKLREALVLIQEHRRMDADLSYQELYKMAYNLVMGSQATMLYTGLDEVIRSHLRNAIPVLTSPATQQGGGTVESVTARYAEHYQSMLRFRDVLLYLDSRRGRSQRPVFDLGLTCFIDEVILHPKVRTQLENEMLAMVTSSREDERIDRQLLKKGTATLIEIGAASDDDPRAVYCETFETPFLEASRRYYKQKSQLLLQEYDCTAYLGRASQCIADEAKLVEHCMHGSTNPRLSKILHEALIGDHKEELLGNADVNRMLEETKVDELRLLFELFNKVPEGVGMLQERLQKHIMETGAAHIASEDGENGAKGPITLVRNFAREMAKYGRILTEAFGKNPDMQLAINKPFEVLLNRHGRISEYLSMYIDSSFKSSLKDADGPGAEVILEGAVWIFRLLQEKDVFERYYKQHLAKRLLLQKAADSELEQTLIQRLKMECGGEYTQRFEAMFKDVRVSDDLMEKFRLAEGGALKTSLNRLDLDVRVLGTNSWPTAPSQLCNLPAALQNAKDVYEGFYHKQHRGRKLTWQTSLGSMTISAKFGKLKEFHVINMTTCQGLLLLLFNGNEGEAVPELTFAEVKAALNIRDQELKRSLLTLSQSKYKILVKTSKAAAAAGGATTSTASSKEICPEDRFSLNPAFSSKKTRIKIPQLVVKESAQQHKVTKVKVEEDRRFQIEACIVRVMKARKRLKHNDLVVEVTTILAPRFTPTPHSIKQRIERLIDSEYLKRTDEDQKTYNYVA